MSNKGTQEDPGGRGEVCTGLGRTEPFILQASGGHRHCPFLPVPAPSAGGEPVTGGERSSTASHVRSLEAQSRCSADLPCLPFPPGIKPADRALRSLPRHVRAWQPLDRTLGRAGVPFTRQGYLRHQQPVQCEPGPWGAAALLRRGPGPWAPLPCSSADWLVPCRLPLPEPARDGITAPAGPHLRQAAVPPGSAWLGPTQIGSLLRAQGRPGPKAHMGRGGGPSATRGREAAR